MFIYAFSNIVLLNVPNTNGINLILMQHGQGLSFLGLYSVMSAIANSFKCSKYTGAHLCLDTIDNTEGWNQYNNWDFVLVPTWGIEYTSIFPYW